MVDNTNDFIDDYFGLRDRTQPTSSLLLLPDPALIKPASSKQDSSPSTPPLVPGNSPKTNVTSFLKISSPNETTDMSPTHENGLLMTVIRTPSNNPSRIQPNEPVGTAIIGEELSNNGKFIKSKVTAALNHMKYRWVVKMRPNFRTNETPIYFLGKTYNGKEETAFDDIPRPHCEQSFANFLKTFSQRIYFSYRKQFEPLTGSRTGDIINSDGGWGCMIRCAQMLLAQTLLIHTTNTCNSYYSNIQISDRCPKRNSIDCFRNSNRINRRTQIYTDIIRLFGDYPHPKCPFGIHKIVELGTSHGIRPGDFFGPVSAAHCLKEAIQVAVEANQIPEMLRIYISQDAIIYRQDVNDLCSAPLSNNKLSSLYPSLDALINENVVNRWFTAVLLLVPLRLGLHELDLIYEEYLKDALKLPQTVGIIGGSPRHAVYILGFQDDSFIDLDPHFIQTTVNVLDESFDISSYSCSSPKKLAARKMDPSCTLGFYCRDKADFEMFCAQWNHVCHMASEDRRTCPIFRIERGTFQESHTRTLTCDYPSLNDEQDVYLRVTKLSSTTNSPLTSNKTYSHPNKLSLVNSIVTNNPHRDSWDDIGRSLNDNNIDRLQSLSDDYVLL